jgi:outer membrane lipase/esterase
LFYALWERADFYVSGSAGIQSLQHDIVRRIKYPSFNPLVPSIDETALSDTDSRTYMGSLNAGYAWRFGGFSVEPYLRGEYQYLDIDGFDERNANGFEFDYGAQTVSSFDASLGLKLQHVFTPAFGVLIPFLRGELHREFGNDTRTIDAVYSGAAPAMTESAANFNIATNEPDERFYTGAVGISAVFKHGLQGFLQYEQTFGLEHIDDRAIGGGVRFEF